MIYCLLSCAHQTHDKINVYHVLIISYLYLTLYHIMSLSYPDHQTDLKTFVKDSNEEIIYKFYVNEVHF